MMFRLILFALLTAIASAQETMFRQQYDEKTDTHVELLALFTKPSPGGYLPVRVKVANNLKGARSIQLNFTSKTDYSSGASTNSNFRIDAPAETTVLRDILVPISPVGGAQSNSFNVDVAMTGTLGTANGSISTSLGNDQPSVLMSDALFTQNASKLDAEVTSRSGGATYSGTEFSGKFDPKQLPDSWLAYSGYDAIFMTDSDWSNVHAAGRNAIVSWVRLGGHLIIYSTGDPTMASLGLPSDASSGKIEITSISTSLELPPDETLDRASVVTAKRISTMKEFANGWALKTAFGEKPFRYLLFIIVLVIFGVLVGPVNLFVFAKSGQRHRLFLTTPAISLGASFILIGLIIFQDGFGGEGQRVVLMEVRPDADQNASFIQQEQISRTGVLSKANFTLDMPALFAPAPLAASRWTRFTDHYDGGKGAFNLQPSSGKLDASGDWFRSRSEQAHFINAVVPSRGRIETAGSAQRLVSTFDFLIETLYLKNADGSWSRASKIETGKPFDLAKVDFSMVEPEIVALQRSFSTRNALNLSQLMTRENHFIAVTESAPAIETHPGIKWRKTQTVITGPLVSP